MSLAVALPDDDPFHLPRNGLDRHAPGTLLGAREVQLAVFGTIRVVTRAWQLRFRTTDLRGRPEVGITTVLRPAASRGILSYQCAIDAVSPRCFPSYALRQGSRAHGALARLELPLILAAARQGWTVSVPDHEGLRGHFGAAREPGYRVLDGLRATREFLNEPSPTPAALWGYSGGGLATLWAAEAVDAYAPGLGVVGAVAGAPVGDPGATFLRLNGGRFAGFPFVFIAALCRAYPELDGVLTHHVSPEFRARIAASADRTTVAVLGRFAFRDLGKHLHFGLDALLADPVLARVLTDIRPGDVAPAVPLLVQQSRRDEVIAAADITALVDRYADAGASVIHRERARGRHLPTQFRVAPEALRWLAGRREHAGAGEPVSSGR
ncbi:lipase family protein [Gordonia sp. PP30]|uniref:lipase family protein n=1 Tax=unclassified Gordonia (in: high G+C Gram-positive bacteria) TaxID=2657482 RepID=UPI001FFF862A|nr:MULTISPECIES: lipase family protein [unclassified Gordonia (in: high G+C Gram-positive bacteria)]UQE75262.1 lipase family protein [Gordonia sp. PP30]